MRCRDNTGKEFIYPDKFQDNLDTYLRYTGQKGEEGFKTSSNTESSGRYHTNWLNMMYPRLKLARNLLRDDGVIFVSIDDGELANLKRIGDEVFGEENFVATFIWEKRKTRENRRIFSFNHDFILCFAKFKPLFEEARNLLPATKEVHERYSNPDNDERGDWQSISLNAQAGHATPSQFYEIETPSGRKVSAPSGRCWSVTKDRFMELMTDNRVWFGKDGNNSPRLKSFKSEVNLGLTPHTLWTADEVGTTDTGKKSLNLLFSGVSVFDTPKPVELIQRMVQISTEPNDIIVDFFAGSCPTAHASLNLNKEDNGNRKFIMVQLPEPCAEKSEAFKANYKTIADIGKERIRRAATKIKEEHPDYNGDLGFKVFKLDSSNIRAWNPDRNDLEGTLYEHTEHLIPGRTEEDILYELLLKRGVDLTVPIEKKKIIGKTVYSIGYGVLFACLDTTINRNEVEELALGIAAWHKELEPATDTQVVFRDSAFADDVAKTNMTDILEQNNIAHVRSL